MVIQGTVLLVLKEPTVQNKVLIPALPVQREKLPIWMEHIVQYSVIGMYLSFTLISVFFISSLLIQ